MSPTAFALLALTVTAHPFVPVMVDLRPSGADMVEVRVRLDSHHGTAETLHVAISPTCEPVAPFRVEPNPTGATIHTRTRCQFNRAEGNDLFEGLTLTISGGWPAGQAMFIRAHALIQKANSWVDDESAPTAEGSMIMLRAEGPEVTTPLPTVPRLGPAPHAPDRGAATGATAGRAPTAAEVVTTYVTVGLEHILFGIDHLLFVLLLMIVVRGWKSLLATITAFTVAHSLTLVLAAFEVVRLDASVVESMIALSIVLLAGEAAGAWSDRGKVAAARGSFGEKPWRVAFLFGLLHGLGFADAILSMGLPQAQLPLALLAFNVGVELGQLAFVCVVMGAVLALSPLARRRPVFVAQAVQVPIYVAGTLAAFWFYERAAGLF